MRSLPLLFLLLAAMSPACFSERADAATADDRAGIVDSTVPRDVALARFRQGLDSTDVLTGGATSREALVTRFLQALERVDTAALRGLAMTPAEFAWIYYPTNPQALPPYDLTPELFWFMLETRGRGGLVHLLQERAGRPLTYLRTDCAPTASREGDNLVWGPCTITRTEGGDEIVERLFGPIIERHGRFKFVSYANKLD